MNLRRSYQQFLTELYCCNHKYRNIEDSRHKNSPACCSQHSGGTFICRLSRCGCDLMDRMDPIDCLVLAHKAVHQVYLVHLKLFLASSCLPSAFKKGAVIRVCPNSGAYPYRLRVCGVFRADRRGFCPDSRRFPVLSIRFSSTF